MDFENVPFAEWVEGLARSAFELKPAKMAFVATLTNGETKTAYYNAYAEDKAVFAHHIQSDVVMDIVIANADILREAMEGDDGEGECET